MPPWFHWIHLKSIGGSSTVDVECSLIAVVVLSLGIQKMKSELSYLVKYTNGNFSEKKKV